MASFENKTILKKTLFLLVVIACFTFLGFYFGKERAPQDLQQLENLASPTAEFEVNRDFEFPTEELDGSEATFKFIIVQAKRVKLVSNRGEPIESKPNEEFLVLSLELQNDSQHALKVDSQDFVRLIGEGDKRYAPDFFNGPTNVSALSVKKDQLAFVVPAGQNQIKLQIGEMGEEKEELEISF